MIGSQLTAYHLKILKGCVKMNIIELVPNHIGFFIYSDGELSGEIEILPKQFKVQSILIDSVGKLPAVFLELKRLGYRDMESILLTVKDCQSYVEDLQNRDLEDLIHDFRCTHGACITDLLCFLEFLESNIF